MLHIIFLISINCNVKNYFLNFRTENIYKNFTRRPSLINHYLMVELGKSKKKAKSKKFGISFDSIIKRYQTEGVKEGLQTLQYSIKSIEKTYLCTRLKVDHHTGISLYQKSV